MIVSFPKPILVVGGGDFGGMGGDPLALTLSAKFDDDTWRTLTEYYKKRCTWFDILGVCREWVTKFHVERFWWDASQLSAIQALAAAGIPAIATNIRDPEHRHRTLYSLARARRWRYNVKDCPNLHLELQTFGYSKSRTGVVKMQERNDHAIDSVTYAICSEGESPEPLHRQEIPPEERAAYYRDNTGQMHFDPQAVIAQARKSDEPEFEPTWDEMLPDENDPEEEMRMHWLVLTGRPYPESSIQ